MAVNYWHRREGLFDGDPGVYHRFPFNRDFTKAARLAFPSLQYREDWGAYWVPDLDNVAFERLALQWNIGHPCGRCRRAEPCTAWPGDRREQQHEQFGGQRAHRVYVDEPGPDFEKLTEEFFKQYEQYWNKQDGPIPTGASDHQADAQSWAQHTYGRGVDPAFDEAEQARQRRERERKLREERDRQERDRQERAWRDVPIQQPPDVRAKAARVLGVEMTADHETIKRAVHRLAMEHHPDRGGSSEKMAEILGARDVLLGKAVRGARR